MSNTPGSHESKECKVFCKKIRHAMCFAKRNPFVISIFFMLFSLDTALQKKEGRGGDPVSALLVKYPEGFLELDLSQILIAVGLE